MIDSAPSSTATPTSPAEPEGVPPRDNAMRPTGRRGKSASPRAQGAKENEVALASTPTKNKAVRPKKASKPKRASKATPKGAPEATAEPLEELEAGARDERDARDEDGDGEDDDGVVVVEAEGAEVVDDEAPGARARRDDDDDPDATEGEGGLDDGDELEKRPLPAAVVKGEAGLTNLDPMALYLREVQRHPLLTPEETNALATQFVKTQDPALAARLVTSNLRLVVKIAYEYRRAYKNIMDLVQEGNIGLMQAVKRYDPYRGVKLSSYAAWWIRAYILRFVLNNWRLVKLGTTQAQRKLFFNLRKAKNELEQMGIDPSHAEIAKRLNVTESDVAEMDVRLSSNEKSLDTPVGDADGRSIARVDMMPAAGLGPEALAAGQEISDLLKDKLDAFRQTLTGKEKEIAIFDRRLVADEPLTLQELGDSFGISRERVRQLEQRLLARLREFLSNEVGDAADVF